ncbi:MAG: class I SAM-dependent methyltransferase [Burkholderiales bacterium]|nr:class I SAM-dependent methyltransferase [Burkholderiales bacterium]MBH2017924.1 class I SAM-dependent methyltransferase [Burkholderiales bacterium]
MMFAIDWAENGLLPDAVIRAGMRRLMAQRLAAHHDQPLSRRTAVFRAFVDELKSSPIAIHTVDANVQHYEVPAKFFHQHLGPRLKYSCCWYERGNETLAQAEEAMMRLYAERAQLDALPAGARVLDLGCGWGSLSLWLAERYPHLQVVGFSNSHGQREFIEGQARERGLPNLRIVTGNVATDPMPADALQAGFDRVLSIEMFEHMRNYQLLLKKVRGWMKDDAKLFVHIFAHPTLAYPYEVKDKSDWMTQYFFLGGIMPSEHLLAQFQDDVKLVNQWWVDGTHYQKTAEHWLQGMDGNQAAVLATFKQCYGDDAERWVQRWRMFYMAVAEFFGYQHGSEWGVAHYLFEAR